MKPQPKIEHCFQPVALWSERFHHSMFLLEVMKNHIFPVYLSQSRAGISSAGLHLSAPDTIALANIPVPACQALVPAPQRYPPPPAHLARLSLWQCPPLLPQSRLSWQGARYAQGPATGAIAFSIMSQTSQGRMGTEEGEGYTERMSEGVGNYALTSFPLSVIGLSHLLYPKRTLRMDDLASATEAQSVAIELDGSRRGEQCSDVFHSNENFPFHPQ